MKFLTGLFIVLFLLPAQAWAGGQYDARELRRMRQALPKELSDYVCSLVFGPGAYSFNDPVLEASALRIIDESFPNFKFTLCFAPETMFVESVKTLGSNIAIGFNPRHLEVIQKFRTRIGPAIIAHELAHYTPEIFNHESCVVARVTKSFDHIINCEVQVDKVAGRWVGKEGITRLLKTMLENKSWLQNEVFIQLVEWELNTRIVALSRNP